MKTHFTIVGNWKMNPSHIQEAKKLRTRYRALAAQYKHINFFYAPPTAYLAALKPQSQDSMQMIAQNVYYEEAGAYTGETSIPMVQSVGASAVIIGHSERRNLFGVDKDAIGKKVEAAVQANMPMIVCIGEHERDNDGAYVDELEAQLETVLVPFTKNTTSKAKLKLLTLAYEPIWAVGAGASRAVTTDELFSTCLLIEKIMSKYMSAARARKIPLLYGGSVDASNIAQLGSVRGINGVLVGRASRDTAELGRMCQAVSDR